MNRVAKGALRAGAGAAALLVSACHAPQDYLRPVGTEQRVAALGWGILLGFCAIALLVTGLLVWLALRRRGSLSKHAPVDAATENEGKGALQVWGIVVPTLVLLATFAVTLHVMAKVPSAAISDCAPGEETTSTVHVYGHQWWFEIQYTFPEPAQNVTTATELHLPVGKPVDIALQSRDVIHSFWVPKLHGKVDMLPDRVGHVRLEAARAGVYEGECGEYCGVQHAHMRLRVVAQSQKDFDAWLEQQRKPASVPQDAHLALGQKTFETGACALCHTIRGTAAHGQIGPDLTHVGSRSLIAGAFVNDTANLASWVVHAQGLKPGAQMPDLPQLEGEQLPALTAYLQSNR